ncbi:MAG: RecX family transcriptional regulator [Chloroflexota bacterium]
MTRIITAIQKQKKDPQRVNIYLDEEFAFGLAGYLAAWLQVGQTLSEEKINKLISEDLLECAIQKALHYLSFRPRSTSEIRKNLAKRDIPENVIEETVDRLQKNFALDDLKFAQDWIENRSDFRPRSCSALRMELRQKGIPDDVIQIALEDIDDDALTLKAAQKYLHRLTGLKKLEFRKKLSSHLARRGFSFASINPVVTLVWNEIQSTSDHGALTNNEEYSWN